MLSPERGTARLEKENISVIVLKITVESFLKGQKASSPGRHRLAAEGRQGAQGVGKGNPSD